MQKDIRAVENPISAMFDLSEDVAQQAPNIRSLVHYASAFIAIWLIINVLLGLVFLFTGQLFLFLVMLVLFIMGVTSLILISRINRFFKYFVARQQAITTIRQMDPMVYAPKGANVTERLVTYFRASIPAFQRKEVEVAMPGIVQGLHGTEYRFDAYIKEPSSGLWKSIGMGAHGFGVFIKAFKAPPTLQDLQALKKAVEDVSQRTGIPPVRVIALWEREEDQIISDAAYNFVMNNIIDVKHKSRKLSCAMEIVSEAEGSYDFIPYIVQ